MKIMDECLENIQGGSKDEVRRKYNKKISEQLKKHGQGLKIEEMLKNTEK